MTNPALGGALGLWMSWWWVLLLKPAIALAMTVMYYGGIIVPLRKLYDWLPPSRLKDALFRERGDCAPAYGPGYRREPADRGHHRPTLPRR